MRKLYDEDAYLTSFQTRVLTCAPIENGTWALTLDASAFFPEGGGQGADRGTLGGVPVLDVQDTPDGILHFVSEPFSPGETVFGEIDFACRFRRMQNHTGEHILSGIAHARYGCENVGFHLGDSEVTMDYDRFLGEDVLDELSYAANRAVWDDFPVTCVYPTPEELSRMTYRSKKEIAGPIRIVTVGDIDRCACCAPHVARTGEIGQIRILSSEKYKGGTRLWIACGSDAFVRTRDDAGQLLSISRALSAKVTECDRAVAALVAENTALRQTVGELRRQILDAEITTAVPSDGPIIRFLSSGDGETARRYACAVAPKSACFAACFVPDGTDSFRFAIASDHASGSPNPRGVDARLLASALRETFSARCGGSADLVSGSVRADQATLTSFLRSCPIGG